MTRSILTSLLIAGTFSLAALAGCQPKSPAPAPVPLGGPVQAANAQSQPAGVSGRADINGVPFANATVKIYRPGETTPIATATTGPDGRFVATVGVIATGGGNVIATGGGNVIATGGGNVIATGGGNVIATGGGNLLAGSPMKVVATKEGQTLAGVGVAGVIATGGGNVIATGGGNVIATGGGNVIATGGGNYTVQAVSKDAVLSLASTLAYYRLGDKLDKALRQAGSGDTINQSALDDVLESFDKVQAAAEQALEQFGDDALAAITQALDDTGVAQAPAEVQAQLDAITQSLETAFQELEQALEQVNTPTTTPDNQSSDDPNTGASDPPPQDSSGGGGNNPIKEDSTNSSGKVAVSGHFFPPYQRPSSSPWPSPSPSVSASPNNFYIFTDGFENGWVKATAGASSLTAVTSASDAPIQHGTTTLRFQSTFGDTSTVSFDLIDNAGTTFGASFTAMHLLYTPITGVETNVQAIDMNNGTSASLPISNFDSGTANGPYAVYNIPVNAFGISPSTIKGFRFTPAVNDGSGIEVFLDDIRLY